MSTTKESVMSQAQVFASAWSLVGGRFDTGCALEDAEQAKAELAEMVGAVFQQRDELLSALKASRKTLELANVTPNGPIHDTIWHGPIETLFDFIDQAIEKAEPDE